jgi:ankyrin repeat protein
MCSVNVVPVMVYVLAFIFSLSYIGDTALHLALRQKKFVCAHALLILGAKADISNNAGVTQEALVFKMTGKTLQLFRRETEVSKRQLD